MGHPAGPSASVPEGRVSREVAGQAIPRSAGPPGRRYMVAPAAEAVMAAVLWAGLQPEPAEQGTELKAVHTCECRGGSEPGPRPDTLQPWSLLTVTWKGLLGTCSPPKRTQMTYLPGWGAV